ncbi:MAG: DUF2231 domain-containing protein, partial [Desulfosalsimonas sp.]
MNVDFIYRLLETLGYTHPIHPPLTHLTIGLVMGALVFKLIAILPGYGKYAPTARHCSSLAFVVVFPTVILGLMDWFHYYGASWIFPIQMKIILAGILILLLVLSIILHIRAPALSGLISVFYLLSFLTVVGVGYFGGELVFGQKFNKADKATTAVEKTAPAEFESTGVVFADVEAVFRNHCTNCHAGTNPRKGLSLSSYQDVMKGSKNHP